MSVCDLDTIFSTLSPTYLVVRFSKPPDSLVVVARFKTRSNMYYWIEAEITKIHCSTVSVYTDMF